VKASAATPSGRRQANKDAVRAALREAAHEQFAERGYEATTVREIAAAAKVTERTFYRYFDGKEGLLAEESLAWLAELERAIRERPTAEPPLLAVREAMRETIAASRDGFGPVHLWLFSNQPRPFATIRRFSPRPFVRLEQTIAGAVAARGSGAADATADGGLEAAVIARVSVAIFRAAVIHSRGAAEGDDAKLAERLDASLLEAFSILARGAAELTDTARSP
jgi:AcrR family transcriptional regulator